MGFPGVAEVKNLPVNTEEARNASSIPRLRRSPGVGWQPTPVLLPRKFMNRGVWWAAVHGSQRVGHD